MRQLRADAERRPSEDLGGRFAVQSLVGTDELMDKGPGWQDKAGDVDGEIRRHVLTLEYAFEVGQGRDHRQAVTGGQMVGDRLGTQRSVSRHKTDRQQVIINRQGAH